MKRIILSLTLMLFMVNGVHANQESDTNVERLTVKPNMQLHLDTKTKDIIIKSIELIDDNYGHGRLIIKAEFITTDGKHLKKQYEKKIESGHDYYSEMLSGPLKTLEDEK